MAKIFDEEFVNEILELKESQVMSQVIDIPTFFDEMIKTMHLILNDAVPDGGDERSCQYWGLRVWC